MLSESPHLLYARDEKGQSAYLIASSPLEQHGLRLDVHKACAGAKIDYIKNLLHDAGSQILVQKV
jgi:hypothetical protein